MNWRGRWHYTYRVPQMWPQTIDCEIEWSTAHINSKLVAFTRATAGILQQTSRCTFHGSHNSAVTVNRTWSVSLSYATRQQDAPRQRLALLSVCGEFQAINIINWMLSATCHQADHLQLIWTALQPSTTTVCAST